MGRLSLNLRFAARMFIRQPTLAAAAVATLALGMGANSAIFSVVDSALLTPPPFRDPGRVVVAWASAPAVARQSGLAEDKLPVTYGDFYDWQRQSRSFAQLAMFEPDAVNLSGAGPPEQLDVIRATGAFSAVLGTPAMLGRGLEPGDDAPGNPRAVLLSYGLWRRSFGGDRGVIGRKVYLNGDPVTVIGVMPPRFAFPRVSEMPADFGFPAAPDAWVPFSLSTALRQDHDRRTATVVGRLRAGVGIAAAEQELRAICGRLARQYPRSNQGFSARLVPVAEQMRRSVRPALRVLWAAVGCVLLIACANVANLLLARAASRQREIAVRTALGAGRGHLIGQLLTESALLALAGGVLGLAVAALGLRVLAALVPVDLAGAVTGSLDARVFAFTGLLCAATSFLAGLVPALQATRPGLAGPLSEGACAGAGSAGGRRASSVLVVAELALAVSLLAGAGLLLRSFIRLVRVDPGFRAAHVLTFDVNPPPDRMPAEARRRLFARVLERLRALPGVRTAAAISHLPFSGGIWVSGWEVEGRPAPKLAELVATDARIVTPDYFAAMGIPLRRGHLLAASDVPGAIPVTVIDDAMARTEWPGEDPIGKRLRGFRAAGSQAGDVGNPWMTVIGVVGSVHYSSLYEPPRPQLYRPLAQAPWVPQGMTFVLRATGDPQALAAAARAAVRELDRDQPVAGVRTLEQVVADSIATRRFALLLLSLFAALAMALSAVGVYGVTYFSVEQRTHELGLRLALGAQRCHLLRLLIAETGALVAAGLAIGLGVAFALTRALSSLLYGVSSADPATFAAVAFALAVAAMLSAWLPGRRALRLDPMDALRVD
jgi:putative ABC transport system permease protein